MHEFKTLILGNTSLAYYAAAEFFALMALILSLWGHSRKRDPLSPNTPYKFSWLFLIMDNIKRIVMGQIAMFLIFRFASELLGRQLSMFMAMGIGFGLSFGLDWALQKLKDKFDFLSINRSNLTTPANPNEFIKTEAEATAKGRDSVG